MSLLAEMFKNLSLIQSKVPCKIIQTIVIPVRFKKEKPRFTILPDPIPNRFRRIVHYPSEYTVKPLKVTNLGGRDPKTGRTVCHRIGGGLKHKYHWVKYLRDGPETDPPKEEKVIQILKCGCRTAYVALVAHNDEMKYILATENMKAGDIIKSSRYIPRNPVSPNEGDAYPLGALPQGTAIHNVQVDPKSEVTLIHSAGSCGLIKRHLDEKVIVALPSRKEILLDPECMATVGKLSNPGHSSVILGSPQKARELGIRPKSGLWHRKTGKFGRKIKPLRPPSELSPIKQEPKYIRCTLSHLRI